MFFIIKKITHKALKFWKKTHLFFVGRLKEMLL